MLVKNNEYRISNNLHFRCSYWLNMTRRYISWRTLKKDEDTYFAKLWVTLRQNP